MKETKKWWQSKTIQAALALIGAMILGNVTEDQLLKTIAIVAEAVSAIMVIIGRVVAKKKIQ